MIDFDMAHLNWKRFLIVSLHEWLAIKLVRSCNCKDHGRILCCWLLKIFHVYIELSWLKKNYERRLISKTYPKINHHNRLPLMNDGVITTVLPVKAYNRLSANGRKTNIWKWSQMRSRADLFKCNICFGCFHKTYFGIFECFVCFVNGSANSVSVVCVYISNHSQKKGANRLEM